MSKFLIDECLSLHLVGHAIDRGYPESSHVVRIGKSGWKDQELMPIILAQDWTFVTANSIDFRGRAPASGTAGLHGRAALHAGLICLNAPAGMNLAVQLALFEAALDELVSDPDLINQCVESTLLTNGIEILRYPLPPEQS